MITIPPCHVLAEYLIDQLIVEDPGGTGFIIYRTHLPDQPDNAVCVYDDDARLDGRLHKTGTVIEHPRFNVLVRSSSYTTGHAKMVTIIAALDNVKNTDVVIDANTYVLHNVTRTSSFLPAGVDPETRRVNFTVNGEMTVSVSGPILPP